MILSFARPKESIQRKGRPWKAFFPVHCPFFGNVWTHEPSARSDSTHSFSENRLWPWGFSTGFKFTGFNSRYSIYNQYITIHLSMDFQGLPDKNWGSSIHNIHVDNGVHLVYHYRWALYDHIFPLLPVRSTKSVSWLLFSLYNENWTYSLIGDRNRTDSVPQIFRCFPHRIIVNVLYVWLKKFYHPCT